MKNGVREISYVEMSVVGAAAIVLVLVIKLITGDWFLLPLVPALVFSLFAAMTLIKDKEWRFEGVIFFLFGSLLLVTATMDLIRFG